jgi:nicotinamide-nucleotide amidase
MLDAELIALTEEVGRELKRQGYVLATAESCTGGWISAAITAVAGSSDWFDRGFVTYSNAAKQDMLGVSPRTLQTSGAVSEDTAREMTAGALKRSRADVAVAVTGIAGPTGGSKDKPVGTVCFAWEHRDQRRESATHYLKGDRMAVRRQSVIIALRGLLSVSASRGGALA